MLPAIRQADDPLEVKTRMARAERVSATSQAALAMASGVVWVAAGRKDLSRASKLSEDSTTDATRRIIATASTG